MNLNDHEPDKPAEKKFVDREIILMREKRSFVFVLFWSSNKNKSEISPKIKSKLRLSSGR